MTVGHLRLALLRVFVLSRIVKDPLCHSCSVCHLLNINNNFQLLLGLVELQHQNEQSTPSHFSSFLYYIISYYYLDSQFLINQYNNTIPFLHFHSFLKRKGKLEERNNSYFWIYPLPQSHGFLFESTLLASFFTSPPYDGSLRFFFSSHFPFR